MPPHLALLPLLRHLRGRLAGDVSLRRLAARSGWSPSHFHRAFRRAMGETPKQYTLRLRLAHAAARLVSGRESVVGVAFAAGFASHEVFTRAFRRHFGQTPTAYRAAGRGASRPAWRRHRAVVDVTGPCLRLYHLPTTPPVTRPAVPTLSVNRQALTEQPMLYVRRRVARHELPTAIAEGVGAVYAHAQRRGIPLAGPPFTRYPAIGAGLLAVEIGMPTGAPALGDGEVEAGALVGGPAVVAVHAGPYDRLAETYAAVERWAEAGGLLLGGAPWESYMTDPADHPDPADWRTTVCWPLAPAPSDAR